jgi:hypothetical protein
MTVGKYKILYERYNIDNVDSSWQLIIKEFATKKEQDLFILRISQNVIVRRVWVV